MTDQKPAYGRETAQAVLDIIRMNPDSWDQTSWEDPSGMCGTTRCIAGWTSQIHRGFVFEVVPCSCSDETCKLMETAHPSVFAAKALGLSRQEGGQLFTTYDEGQAIHALEYLAKGEKIDWEAVQNG